MVKTKGKVYFWPARRMGGEGRSAGLIGIFRVRNLCEASVRPLMEGVVDNRSTKACAVPVQVISNPAASEEMHVLLTSEGYFNFPELGVVLCGNVNLAFTALE